MSEGIFGWCGEFSALKHTGHSQSTLSDGVREITMSSTPYQTRGHSAHQRQQHDVTMLNLPWPTVGAGDGWRV